jgi:hypothetical protein
MIGTTALDKCIILIKLTDYMTRNFVFAILFPTGQKDDTLKEYSIGINNISEVHVG